MFRMNYIAHAGTPSVKVMILNHSSFFSNRFKGHEVVGELNFVMRMLRPIVSTPPSPALTGTPKSGIPFWFSPSFTTYHNLRNLLPNPQFVALCVFLRLLPGRADNVNPSPKGSISSTRSEVWQAPSRPAKEFVHTHSLLYAMLSRHVWTGWKRGTHNQREPTR